MAQGGDPQVGERDRRTASRIATKFGGRYQCEACAAEIIKALGRESGARALRIRPADGTLVIGLAETQSLVSNNGFHVGVLVGDRVFDNLHSEGVPAEVWAGRFITRGGAPLIQEGRPVSDFFGARFQRQRFRDWTHDD